MSRALMVGGVFLLSRDPASLAEWYGRHLGWQLEHLEDGSYYAVLQLPDDRADDALPLVFAIMPGDPGAGDGHIIN